MFKMLRILLENFSKFIRDSCVLHFNRFSWKIFLNQKAETPTRKEKSFFLISGPIMWKSDQFEKSLETSKKLLYIRNNESHSCLKWLSFNSNRVVFHYFTSSEHLWFCFFQKHYMIVFPHKLLLLHLAEFPTFQKKEQKYNRPKMLEISPKHVYQCTL